jgi:ABC-type uncharacterized transport system involved in gliding motility auxiliary subunit
MKINRKTHWEIRLQNLLFTILFLGIMAVVAWLSTRYATQFDWTAGHRHTLSEASIKVLDMLQGPVQVTAYARETKTLRDQISEQIGRYQRHKKDLMLSFVNPDTQPDKIRELGISVDGELVLEYQGRSENVQEANETAITNALQRLARAKDQRVVFLEGHGERSPQGRANHDLGQFGEELGRKGIQVSTVNLAVTQRIPERTDVLVIASPNANLLPGEVSLIEDWVKRGGQLLWLVDSANLRGLDPLAQKLGLRFLPGTVVDASTQLFGIDDPTFALVAEYPPHAITYGFQTITLFPGAVALDVNPENRDFEREALLNTLPRSWTETGPIQGKIQLDTDKGERQGPLHIAYVLTREMPIQKQENAGQNGDPKTPAETGKNTEKPREQRIVVIGDGDFLSNAFLGNGGNLNLGLNIINWLSQNDPFINIPAKTSPDRSLQLSPMASWVIGFGFLIVLPLLLIGSGVVIWFQRRKR